MGLLNGLELEITEFFKQAMSWPDNKLEGTGGEPAWDDFLLGAALGADEIFDKFTEAVGPEFDKPAALSFAEAACLPTAWLTAYSLLFRASELRPGSSVLVQGAGGGVSSAAIALGVLPRRQHSAASCRQ